MNGGMMDDSPVLALTREGARAVAMHPGLKGSDWRVLFYVMGQLSGSNVVEPFSITEASEELGLSRPTVSASLKRLREAGILYKEHPQRTGGVDYLNENVGVSAYRVYREESFPDMG